MDENPLETFPVSDHVLDQFSLQQELVSVEVLLEALEASTNVDHSFFCAHFTVEAVGSDEEELVLDVDYGKCDLVIPDNVGHTFVEFGFSRIEPDRCFSEKLLRKNVDVSLIVLHVSGIVKQILFSNLKVTGADAIQVALHPSELSQLFGGVTFAHRSLRFSREAPVLEILQIMLELLDSPKTDVNFSSESRVELVFLALQVLEVDVQETSFFLDQVFEFVNL